MNPRLGKIAPETFARDVAPRLGAARAEVLVGPRAGSDSAIVALGDGRVLAQTTDPLSIVPALGFEASARLAAHLVASDLWTTAIAPAWASVSFHLPPHFGDDAFARYWAAMSAAWEELGVAVVTGHTGRYTGCDLTIVGAATVTGIGAADAWLTPSRAAPGERVIVSKGAAIEVTALAGHVIADRLDPAMAARARARLADVSVVADCRAAISAGVRDRGVTALHDATEGGVLGGLLELAQACGHDVAIERARIPVAPETRAVCEALAIDPWWALSEGTLIATAHARDAAAVLGALADAGIAAADVGEVVPGTGALQVRGDDGRVERITAPREDPWWRAWAKLTAEGVPGTR